MTLFHVTVGGEQYFEFIWRLIMDQTIISDMTLLPFSAVMNPQSICLTTLGYSVLVCLNEANLVPGFCGTREAV